MNDITADMFDHAAIFESLKSLTGDWYGVNEQGEPTHMNYTLTANDTALVENWTFHNNMEALTIYNMDHKVLMAMHYCPIGNQPRLDLKLNSDGTLYRNETYVEGDGQYHSNGILFRREFQK